MKRSLLQHQVEQQHNDNTNQKKESTKIGADLENSVPPSSIKKINSSMINNNKNNNIDDDNTKTPSSCGNHGLKKRKALGDITNQEKTKSHSHQTTVTKQAKKIKSESVIDNQKNINALKNVVDKKPQFKLPIEVAATDESTCEPIEFCPTTADRSVTDFLEYPTPVFMEFNPETGRAEDVFVTLSDDKMKELTKPPIREESSLPFTVCSSGNDSSGLPLPSPMPSAITPISFDDIFDVL